MKSREDILEYNRINISNRRKKARLNGMCIECCIRKPKEGFKKCDKCRKSNNYYRVKLSEEGRCAGCGRDLMGQTTKYCMLCGVDKKNWRIFDGTY